MPGTCTSIAYLALPLTLVDSSTRITSRPIRRNSDVFFSASGLISGATAGSSANAAISPYPRRRPDLPWTTTPGSVVNSARGTFQCFAALSMSTLRTCAPKMRNGVKKPVTEALDAVCMTPPKPGLP